MATLCGSPGLAFVAAVAAEMVAGDSGIGYYITSMQYAGRGADMFAALFLVGLCGYLINRGFLAIEDRVLAPAARLNGNGLRISGGRIRHSLVASG